MWAGWVVVGGHGFVDFELYCKDWELGIGAFEANLAIIDREISHKGWGRVMAQDNSEEQLQRSTSASQRRYPIKQWS